MSIGIFFRQCDVVTIFQSVLKLFKHGPMGDFYTDNPMCLNKLILM